MRMHLLGGGRGKGAVEVSDDGRDDPTVRYKSAACASRWDPWMAVSSTGSISAMFRVPGLITLPSASHNVAIVQLKLDASMPWITAPKVDTRVHLKVCNSCFS
jgi:hypothetical protein